MTYTLTVTYDFAEPEIAEEDLDTFCEWVDSVFPYTRIRGLERATERVTVTDPAMFDEIIEMLLDTRPGRRLRSQ